jgi:hypothetical protein
MFDNLREDAATSYEEGKYQPAVELGSASGVRQKRILGMTSFQRFMHDWWNGFVCHR